tara:strand:- start:24622 stop:25251 length:630 start_codon:yes stop_codon:yes gene_type:complete
MEIKVLNQSGKSKSKIALPEVVFGQKFNEDLVHQLVTTYISNGHQNTKGQKNRSAVRGGGRKPWKQKGTGRARAGTIRSPIWRGGGVTFANKFQKLKPKKINKKMYKAAIRSIFSKLLKEEKLIAINDIQIDSPPKSSQVKELLNKLNLKTAVILLKEKNELLEIAARNLKEVELQLISSVNPPRLINAKAVLMTEEAIKELIKIFSNE